MAYSNDPVSVDGRRSGPPASEVATQLAALADLDAAKLRAEWRRLYRTTPPRRLSRDLLIRAIAYKLQERALGGLRKTTQRKLKSLAQRLDAEGERALDPARSLKCGARLVREWGGKTHSVLVLHEGFEYRGERYRSLSQIARLITGAHWSGPRFFALSRASKPFSHE
jgi:hypothetical protein